MSKRKADQMEEQAQVQRPTRARKAPERFEVGKTTDMKGRPLYDAKFMTTLQNQYSKDVDADWDEGLEEEAQNAPLSSSPDNSWDPEALSESEQEESEDEDFSAASDEDEYDGTHDSDISDVIDLKDLGEGEEEESEDEFSQSVVDSEGASDACSEFEN